MYEIAITYGVVSLLLHGGFSCLTFEITHKKERLQSKKIQLKTYEISN